MWSLEKEEEWKHLFPLKSFKVTTEGDEAVLLLPSSRQVVGPWPYCPASHREWS